MWVRNEAVPSSAAARLLKQVVVVTGLLFLITFSALYMSGKLLPALGLFAAPILLLMMSKPKWSLYLFLILVALYAPYRTSFMAIHPFDMAALVLVAAVFIDYIIHGNVHIRMSELDPPFLVLITATVISALFAYNKSLTIVPVGRIILLYLIFHCLFTMTLRLGVRRVVVFYILQVFILSLLNIALFLKSGGAERIYGPAWLGFEPYSMTAFPMAVMFLLLSNSRAERWRWSCVALVILLAVFATQARGPLLTVILSLPVALFAAGYYRRNKTIARLGPVRVLVPLVVIVALVLLLLGPVLYQGLFVRVEDFLASMKHPQGTVALRLVLWQTALEGFLKNPITGVGIGNFKNIAAIVPQAKLNPLWQYVSTMSAHNVILHYLCETGLFGAIALLWLAWRGVKEALVSFVRSECLSDAQTHGALFVAMAVFAITLFYMRAWTWGQEGCIMAILFGITAAAISGKCRKQKQDVLSHT